MFEHDSGWNGYEYGPDLFRYEGRTTKETTVPESKKKFPAGRLIFTHLEGGGYWVTNGGMRDGESF